MAIAVSLSFVPAPPGSLSSNNNGPFYVAFARAWRKATTVGQDNLRPLQTSCERT